MDFNLAINNLKCLECNHEEVCRIKDIILKFDENAKKPLFVDITIDECKRFDELTIVDEEE